MLKRPLLACLCLLPTVMGFAAELGVGATREAVIAELGAPKSKIAGGGREILGYPDMRVVLIGGKVTEIDRKGSSPVPAATAAAPAQANVPRPTPTPVRSSASSRDVWRTDFAAAQAEATESKRRLLVLFTGSDWCPPCIQFEGTVAHAPAFLKATEPAFVLVKLDYPRNTPQPAALRARNEELLKRYGVNSYPSLLVISADGSKSARVDTHKPRQARDLVDLFVQAVDEARLAKEKSSFWPW
jgi:thiol-disulfide isomerase/thioredoxin